MECERVREEFIDRLTGTLDCDRAREIDEHLAGCAACRAETGRMRAIWEELGSLKPVPSTGGARRVERLIDARGRASSTTPDVGGATRRSLMPRAALGATVIAASLLVGLVVGRRSAGPADEARNSAVVPARSASSTPAKEQYLLLLEGPARTRPAGIAPTAADSAAEQAIVAEYGAWAGRLRRSGALVLAEKLADEPIVIHARGGVITPTRHPADEVGGFFLIQVADSAEANRIVRECPHLKYGGTVQLRRIQPT